MADFLVAQNPVETRQRRTLNEATRGSIMAQSPAMSPGVENLAVGDRVSVGRDQMRGTLRFLGGTTFSAGEWAGVELDEPHGKNDGSVKGERYFECPKEHGLFVRPNVLVKVGQASKRNSFAAAAIDRPSNMGRGELSQHEDDPPSQPPGRRTVRMSEVIEEVPPMQILMAKAQAANAAEPKAIQMDSDAESDEGREREGAQVRRSSLENLDSMDWCMSSPAPSPGIRPAHESKSTSSSATTKLDTVRRDSAGRRESGGSRRDSSGRRSSREKEPPLPTTQSEDRRQAQRELADATENHDMDRLRRLIPLAERIGVPPSEIEAAQNILNFQVQQQLLDEIEDVRYAVKSLSEAVQVAEVRAAAVEKATSSRHTKSDTVPKRAPAGASREDGEAWMSSVGERLEERVWNGLEQRLEDAICAAVMRATQDLVSVAREIGQLQAPNGVNGERRPSLTVRARPGEMEEDGIGRLRPGEDSPPRKAMPVDRSAPTRQTPVPHAAQAQSVCKPSDLARFCLRGAYMTSSRASSEVSGDMLTEIERLKRKMELSRRSAEATVTRASKRIQAVERGRQSRRKTQIARTQSLQLRVGSACRKIQVAVRRWQSHRRSCGIKDFATVAHAARRKHAAWAAIYDRQLTGGGIMASRGLGEAAFNAAIMDAHTHISRRQASALWSGYTIGTRKPGVDIKGFCSIAEAVAVGPDAASEFADLCIEDYEALKDSPRETGVDEKKDLCIEDYEALKDSPRETGVDEKKADVAKRSAAHRIQDAVRRWLARRRPSGADRFEAAVEATCSRLKAWTDIFQAAAREAHGGLRGERNGHGGLREASFRKAILEVHPKISAGQMHALWSGFKLGTDKDTVDLKAFCAIVEAIYVGDDAAAEFADMSIEAFQQLGAQGGDAAASRIQAIYKGKLARKHANSNHVNQRRPHETSRPPGSEMPAPTPAVARTPPRKPPPDSHERRSDISARQIQRLFRRRSARRKREDPAHMHHSSITTLMRHRHSSWVTVFEKHARKVRHHAEIAVEVDFEVALLTIHPRLSQAQVHALWVGYLSCTDLNGMGIADFCALVEAVGRSDEEAAEFADLSAEKFRLLASHRGPDVQRSCEERVATLAENEASTSSREIARFMSSFAYRRAAADVSVSQTNKEVAKLMRGSIYRLASGTQR